MTEVLRVSKPGYDVLTDNDPTHWIFNSENNVFKVFSIGNKTVNVTYVDDGFGGTIGQATGTIPHNLGYVPMVFAFYSDSGLQIPYFWHQAAGISASISYRMDATNLYIDIYDTGVFGFTGNTIPFNFKYNILVDKII